MSEFPESVSHQLGYEKYRALREKLAHAEARGAKLELALSEAIKWIENADEDTWGYANNDQYRWPLRDELASKLRAVLKEHPDE